MDSTKDYFWGMDVLKFLAACVILLYHYHLNTSLECLSIFANGWIAVELFFMISGFLTIHSLPKNKESFRSFFVRKTSHYLPMSMLIVLLYATMGCIYYKFNGTWYRPGTQIAVDYWNLFTSLTLSFAGGL